MTGGPSPAGVDRRVAASPGPDDPRAHQPNLEGGDLQPLRNGVERLSGVKGGSVAEKMPDQLHMVPGIGRVRPPSEANRACGLQPVA